MTVRSKSDHLLLFLQANFEQWQNGLLDNALDSIGSAIDMVCPPSYFPTSWIMDFAVS